MTRAWLGLVLLTVSALWLVLPRLPATPAGGGPFAGVPTAPAWIPGVLLVISLGILLTARRAG